MSLSRSQVRELRSAGWEVIGTGPAVELCRFLRSVFSGRRRRPSGRVEPVGSVVHQPARRSVEWSR